MNEESWTGSLPSISVASRPSPSRGKKSGATDSLTEKGRGITLVLFSPRRRCHPYIAVLTRRSKVDFRLTLPVLRTDAASAVLWISNVPSLSPPGLTLLILTRITHLALAWTCLATALSPFSSTWLHPYSFGVRAVPLEYVELIFSSLPYLTTVSDEFCFQRRIWKSLFFYDVESGCRSHYKWA